MIIFKLLAAMILVLLISQKLSIGWSLIIGGTFMGIISYGSFVEIVNVISSTLLDPLTHELVLAILGISLLGFLMDQLNYMDRMIQSLEKIVRNIKVTLLLTPAIIGTLLVTGGALMSCPMVDNLGDKVNLANDKKATINMVFRHGLYFVYPLSPPIILAIKLGGFNTWHFIKLMIPMSVAMYMVGYFILLKDVESLKHPRLSVGEYIGQLVFFVLNSFPIILSVVGVFVFNLPFYQGILLGILFIFLMYYYEIYVLRNREKVEMSVRVLLTKGIKWSLLVAMVGIMYFKNIVGGVSELTDVIELFILQGLPVEVIIFIAAGVISFSLASTQPGIAILFPIILPLAGSFEIKILYGMFIYVSSFVFYYASPLHMCQVLTLDYFNVSLKKLYKNYKVILPVVYLTMLSVYFINYYVF